VDVVLVSIPSIIVGKALTTSVTSSFAQASEYDAVPFPLFV